MNVIARIELLVQTGPDSWDLRPVTKLFAMNTPVKDILAWAQTHGSGLLLNDIELTQPDG